MQVRRKEAIYRQMLEYRRFYQEETRKVEALEAQRRAHEAAVQAVELCWSQVSVGEQATTRQGPV